MAAMEGVLPNQPPQPMPAERLNDAVQQQLNLESVKTRATSLFKAISRILDELNAYAYANTTPKWQDILSQYSMVNLELFNIVDEIKKVSKAFVVHPRNVNAENATVLPVMLSSKLLPEMEVEDNAKRDQLLHGLQTLPINSQIDKLKARIDMISAACESAEKVLADTRKAYGFGARQGLPIVSTLDKAQAAKVQEQESLLRAAVNFGEGLRLPVDQRHNAASSRPMHLVDVLSVGDGVQANHEQSGTYSKNTAVSSSNLNGQSPMQASGSQLMGRQAASPGGTSVSNFETTTTSPLPYANSPRSNMMNTPSPQQQSQQQKQQQQQQQLQQQQKFMQLPQDQQQLLAQQQQLRQSAMQRHNQMQQLHDLQVQQKFQPLHGQHQMQYPQTMGHQQFQGRQHVQHGITQNQLNPGNQMSRHLTQFSGTTNSALFNAAQTTPSQMIPNISATMSSQSLMPRMQFDMSGSNPQRSHASSQMLSDQMFNTGAGNTGGMMPLPQQQQQQQQQHGSHSSFGSIPPNAQLQSNMVPQNHPNFGQQRQQNQQ